MVYGYVGEKYLLFTDSIANWMTIRQAVGQCQKIAKVYSAQIVGLSQGRLLV